MKNEFDYLNDVKMDLSIYEEVKLTDMECSKMKNSIKKNKKISIGKVSILAACIAVLALGSQTVFAKDFVSNIIKTISTGHNQFSQMDSSISDEELQAINLNLYDSEGNPVEYTDKDFEYYDKNGEKIAIAKTDVSDEEPLEYSRKSGYPIITDESEINSYLSFKAKLPTYLPEGFTFHGASAYGEDYLFVYYMNKSTGKHIMIDERAINDETAFSAGTDGKVEPIKINSYDAVMMDDRNIDWECDGISVGVSGRGEITRDELIKIAESI